MQDKTPSKNVTKQQRKEISVCLQFSMEDGVHPVPQHTKPLTRTVGLQPVAQMAKEEDGPTKYTTSQVSLICYHTSIPK